MNMMAVKIIKLLKTKNIIVAFSLAIISIVWFLKSEPIDNTQYIVTTKSFSQEVLVRGELKPERVFQVKSQISSNKAKLLWMVEDGTFVKKGDVLALFDTTAYDEKLILSEQKLADAKATYELVTRQFSIQKEEEQKSVSNAQKELEIAELKVADMLNGKGPMTREVIVMQLTQSKRSYNISYAELTDFELLFNKGHISNREFGKVKDKVTQLEEQLEMQEKQLYNFDTYDWPKIKREAEITQEKAKAEYLSSIKISELNLHKYQSSVIKAQRDIVRVEKQIEKILLDIKACNVVANLTGQVFHTKLPRSEGLRKIQVGDNVFSGQTFIQIPDTESLMFETVIREFDLALVKPDQKAIIELDAFPSVKLKANVNFISSLANNSDNKDINQFAVRLNVLPADVNAKVGMYGQAKIIVNDVKEQVAIPLSYVKQDSKGFWVSSEENQKVYITTGVSNHEWVEVVHGLSVGDIIIQRDS